MVFYQINEDNSITEDTGKCYIRNDIIDTSCKFNKDTKINKCISSEQCHIPLGVFNSFDDIVISLSGGVDSLVCLHIYSNLYPNRVKAIMINYMNRSTCDYEEAFVKYICNKLSVPLYIRRIEEVQRTRGTNRENYEEYTHNVRFNCYRLLKGVVIMGHNFDDCMENVFSNIKKMKHMDNLLGMKPYSVIEGVGIYRPMLNIKKKDIIGYADLHMLPYLEDSTPKWSERGIMRDHLIPAIDDDILENMPRISEQLGLLYGIYNKSIEDLTINKTDNIITVRTIEYNEYYYLNQLFVYLSKRYNIPVPGHKVVKRLVSSKDGVKVTYGDGKYISLVNNDIIMSI